MRNKLGKENILTITYQAKIKVNQETKKQLQFISQGCNVVYNWALTKRIEADKQRLKQPSKFQQAKDLTDLKNQAKYQWSNQKKTYFNRLSERGNFRVFIFTIGERKNISL